MTTAITKSTIIFNDTGKFGVYVCGFPQRIKFIARQIHGSKADMVPQKNKLYRHKYIKPNYA